MEKELLDLLTKINSINNRINYLLIHEGLLSFWENVPVFIDKHEYYDDPYDGICFFHEEFPFDFFQDDLLKNISSIDYLLIMNE